MTPLNIALSLIVRRDSRRAAADRWLACLDGEATLGSLRMALAG